MRNKKSIYILLPLVVVIWGIVIYKMIVGKGSSNNNVKQSYSLPEIKEVEMNSVPELTYNYSDPFLKNNTKVRNVIRKESDEKPPSSNRVIRWPRIDYKGCVSAHADEDKLGILMINGKKLLVRSNEDYEGLKVITIQNDSIGLEYQREQKYFALKPSL